MRTHADILRPGDDQALAAELKVSIHTVRSWRQRNSIPPEYWAALASIGTATADELMAAAPPRKRRETARQAA